MNPEPFYWAVLLSLYFLSPIHRRYLRWLARDERTDPSRRILFWQWGAVAMVLFSATMWSLQ